MPSIVDIPKCQRNSAEVNKSIPIRQQVILKKHYYFLLVQFKWFRFTDFFYIFNDVSYATKR